MYYVMYRGSENVAAVCGDSDGTHDYWVNVRFFQSEEKAYNLIWEFLKDLEFDFYGVSDEEYEITKRKFENFYNISDGEWSPRENLSLSEIKEFYQTCKNYFTRAYLGLAVGCVTA